MNTRYNKWYDYHRHRRYPRVRRKEYNKRINEEDLNPLSDAIGFGF